MRQFLIFTLLFICSSAFSQQDNKLFGKWVYSDFKKDGLTKQQINDLNEMKSMFENSYVI